MNEKKKYIEVGKLKEAIDKQVEEQRLEHNEKYGTESPYTEHWHSVTMTEGRVKAIIDSLAVELETALLRLEEDAKALPANRDAAHMIEHILASLRSDYEDEGNVFGLRMVRDAEAEYAKLKAKREPLPIETLAEDQKALPPEVNEAVNEHFHELVVDEKRESIEADALVKARENYRKHRYEIYHSEVTQEGMDAITEYIGILEQQVYFDDGKARQRSTEKE